MDFENANQAAVIEAVDRQLRDYFDVRRPELAVMGQPVDVAVGYLEDFCLQGGKRVRPLFAWAGFLAGGGATTTEDPQAVVQAISSLELIQACALIHDDIIDSSDTRRGQPPVHRRAQAEHEANQWASHAQEFGNHIGILTGDLALAWADDMLADAGLSEAANARLRPAWRAMRSEVIGGQILDITVEAAGINDEQLSHTINRFKTAAYTIERPLHLGAAIAGADEDTITALRAFGTDIGLAYQLRDDLLGVFGDVAITGKPAGDDLREGKRTVLICLALEQADAATAAYISEAVGAVQSPEEIAALANTIAATGAPELVEQRISSLIDSGLAHLSHVELPARARRLLEELTIRATQRRF